MLVPELGPQYILLPGRPAAGLIPGQHFTTVIQGAQEQPILLIGGARVPLDLSTGLVPGQAVRVEVLQEGNSLQLLLTPLPPQSDNPAAASTLAGPLAQALTALNLLGQYDTAAQLIPAGLPASPDAFQALLSLLFSGGSLGRELQYIATQLSAPGAAGLLPPETAALLITLMSAQQAAANGNFLALLRQAGAGKPVEARLAAAIKSGNISAAFEAMREDLQQVLMALRGNGAVRAFLQARGGLNRFEDSLQRILDRLDGTQWQNLRALESAYFFLEVPVPPESAFTRAQIHVFGDGKRGKDAIDPKNAAVILDLSVSRLGDLWIALRVQQGHCQCEIRAVRPGSATAIEAASEELSAALAGAGYPGARITVLPWEGNRIEELAALMRRFTGIDVNA